MARRLDAMRSLRGRIPGQSLLRDLDAFDQLEHADIKTVPRIPDDGGLRLFRKRGHDRLEIILLSAAIRLDLPQIPDGTAFLTLQRAAHRWTRTPIAN